MVYQFLVFMRTDIYYVLGNWLRLGDLMGDTRHWLANQVRRLIGRDPTHDLGGVPARNCGSSAGTRRSTCSARSP
ncbi:hypothetical protein NKG94_15620 [Micromonospora sp. M12]